ncbi:hypothetical protein FAUST_10786 [Fusarium austroamericanum]|uniref:Uncharacterized protein n=1 Tax=Fusarium austroamericanum TaxID=282268 RepID=A0AAN5Z0N0_FUSAU|nr:hypothetical protein FAUST_10786 [Fusarium austroamericanum]
MSEALTVLLLKSQVADRATVWPSHSTSDTLETAGASYMNSTSFKSLTEHDEEVAVNVAADMQRPTKNEGPMPNPNPTDLIQGVPVAPDEALWPLEGHNIGDQGIFMQAMEGEQMTDEQLSTTLD